MNEHEEIYKTMSSSGAAGIAAGIVICVVGIAAGVVMIITGARLLLRKRDVML